MGVPHLLFAQSTGWNADLQSLHRILQTIKTDLLPLSASLINVGRGIGAFAALWFIAEKVWQHLARAESIDFYPLLRPFAIGLAIVLFPSVITVMDGVLQPITDGTAAMVEKSDATIALLLAQKNEAVKNSPFYEMYAGEGGAGDREKWYQYTHPGDDPASEGWLEAIGNDFKFAITKMNYDFRLAIKKVIAEILEFVYAAVSLAIDTLRTFRLVILAILGPLVFAISIFNGFAHTLRHWIARYINIFLWLPVANIFGAVLGRIQEQMLRIDLGQIDQYGDTFFSRLDMGYMVFLLIGIIGYCTVPSIANEIVWVGGSDALTRKTTGMVAGSASGMVNTGIRALEA
jgi:conjugative transposon TraJ protein